MYSPIERLTSLRVSDVMSKDVVTIASTDTMSQAADVLAKNGVSGAPVVDEQGQFIGILSANDFVSLQAGAGSSSPSVRASAEASSLVRSHMSPAVQTVSSGASVIHAARVMCAEHFHRLPVADEQGRIVGMVTSLDLVAAMVNVFEEAKTRIESKRSRESG